MIHWFGCLIALNLQRVYGDSCPVPPVEANYTNSLFEGLWYEIGKIQTVGGAIFEHSCVCTTLDVKFDNIMNVSSQATVSNVCDHVLYASNIV